MPRPKTKTGAGGVAGAASTLLIFILERLGVDMPADAAAAIVVLVSFLVAHYSPEAQPQETA